MPEKTTFDDLPLSIRLNTRRSNDSVPSLRKVQLSRGKRGCSNARHRGPIRGVSAPATKSGHVLLSRRVVVKARVVKMNRYGVGAAKLHLRYLDREGTGKEQEKERFYDQDNDGLSREKLDAIKRGEPHQFRFVVSPEDAERLDLTKYTRALMQQVENDLGRRLEWKAINHYNTDNPHSHIVVHGLDKKGEAVYIDREYISNGIRNRASDIATRELGQRLEHEIKQSIQRDIKERALTRIDHQLLREADGNQVVLPAYGDSPSARLQRTTMLGRLTELQNMGLAEKRGHDVWQLNDNLKKELQGLQQHTEITQRFSLAENRLDYPAHEHRIYSVQPQPSWTGVVIDKGIRDELSDAGYVMVGDQHGRLNYIEVGSLSAYEDIPVNATVSVQHDSGSWVKASDRHLAQFAQQHVGQFDTHTFEDWAVSEGKVSHEKLSGFVQAHQQRLQTLVRHGLVQKTQTGWKIPDDLLARLEQKSQAPKTLIIKQHHLTLQEQVTYRGRTYLDDHYHALAASTAHNGVSKKFSDTVRRRAQWLQKQGLEVGTQVSRNQLDELERRTLATGITKKTGLNFKSLAQGESMQGQHLATLTTKSTRRYAVIANEKAFAMVPWKTQQSLEKGQHMAIGINAQGRAWAKQLQRGLER